MAESNASAEVIVPSRGTLYDISPLLAEVPNLRKPELHKVCPFESKIVPSLMGTCVVIAVVVEDWIVVEVINSVDVPILVEDVVVDVVVVIDVVVVLDDTLTDVIV